MSIEKVNEYFKNFDYEKINRKIVTEKIFKEDGNEDLIHFVFLSFLFLVCQYLLE